MKDDITYWKSFYLSQNLPKFTVTYHLSSGITSETGYSVQVRALSTLNRGTQLLYVFQTMFILFHSSIFVSFTVAWYCWLIGSFLICHSKLLRLKKKKKKELEKIAKDNNSTIYTESMNYLECHNWSTVFWDPKLGVWAVWVQVEKEKHAFLNGD